MKLGTAVALGLGLAACGAAAGPERGPIPIGPVAGQEPPNNRPPAAATADNRTTVPITADKTPTPTAVETKVDYGTADRVQSDATVSVIKKEYPTVKNVNIIGTSGRLASLENSAPLIRTDSGDLLGTVEPERFLADPGGKFSAAFTYPDGAPAVTLNFGTQQQLKLAQELHDGIWVNGNVRVEPAANGKRDFVNYVEYTGNPTDMSKVTHRVLATVDTFSGKVVASQIALSTTADTHLIAYLLPERGTVGPIETVNVDAVFIGENVYLVPENARQKLAAPLPNFTAEQISVPDDKGNEQKFITVSNPDGSQIAVSDASGVLVWNSDSWKALKDSDKALMAKWLFGQKDAGINLISVTNPDNSKTFAFTPDGKNLMYAPKGADALVFDKAQNKYVASIKGISYASYDIKNGWQYWYIKDGSAVYVDKIGNFSLQPEYIDGQFSTYHYFNTAGKEVGLLNPTDRRHINNIEWSWNAMSMDEKTAVFNYLVDHINFSENFGTAAPEIRQNLKTNMVLIIDSQLPTPAALGLGEFWPTTIPKTDLTINSLLEAYSRIKQIVPISGITNYGTAGGIRLADAYYNDPNPVSRSWQTFAWVSKEAMVILGFYVASDQKYNAGEDFSTIALVSVLKNLQTKLGNNVIPDSYISNQVEKVKTQNFPKPL